LVSACTAGFKVSALGSRVPTTDGEHVWNYRLVAGGGREVKETPSPKVVVFYLSGSSLSAPVTRVIGAMAGFVMMDAPVFLVERRGIEPKGVDAAAARRFATKSVRVADALASIRQQLAAFPAGTPVLVVGESEGADVAAAVARAEPRVTHLLLLGGGGGMSQAQELELLASRDPGALGLRSTQELEQAFAAIRANPDSGQEWLGLPYRRWSSFLWSPLGEDLLASQAHVFVAHGARDTSVPVESARALRGLYAASGRTELTFREYPELDHSFRDASGRFGLPLIEVEFVPWLREQGIIGASDAERYLKSVYEAHPEWFTESGQRR
jgi:pimeloyl-ACP methyl ester carboxylesterase